MNISDFYLFLENEVVKGKPPVVVESGQGAYLKIGGKQKLNFCSNNYLGLAGDTHLQKAAIAAIKKFGVGTGSVRALSGTNSLHIELEEKLAKFKKAQAALVLTGGYMANLAAIQTIIGKEDIVISDELNHASIIDAVRLSGVKNKFIYKHTDMKDLERCLKEANSLASSSWQVPNGRVQDQRDSGSSTRITDTKRPRILIVTDGVFSMDGDLAPLPQIVKLAQEYSALTMVD